MITPNKIPGLKLWMDASDVSTINEGTASEGTIVYKWVDKSGSGVKFRNPFNGLTPPAGPTYSLNRFGGKNVISQNINLNQSQSIFSLTLWANVPAMDRSTFSFYFVHVPIANKSLLAGTYRNLQTNYFSILRGDYPEAVSSVVGGNMFLQLTSRSPNNSPVPSPNTGPISKIVGFPGTWTNQNAAITLLSDEDNDVQVSGSGLVLRTYPYTVTYTENGQTITRTITSSSIDKYSFTQPIINESVVLGTFSDTTDIWYKYDKVNIYSYRCFDNTKKYSVNRIDNEFLQERLFSTGGGRIINYGFGPHSAPAFPPSRSGWPPVFTLGAQWCPPVYYRSLPELDNPSGVPGRGYYDTLKSGGGLNSIWPAEQFICEILYYDRPLDDSEHRSVMKYLKDKWFDSKTFSSFY